MKIRALFFGVLLVLTCAASSLPAHGIEIWYEDNNLNTAGGYPADLFDRYSGEENLSQWAAARSIMDTYYLRQNTYKNNIQGNQGFQQLMATVHNADGISLAYDCTAATWAHYLNDYETPDFSSTISELLELTQNGFVLSHIGLQSVLSKPLPDGGTYDIAWRILDAVEFVKQVEPVFPDVKIGIICAAPAKGLPYESWYLQLRDAVSAAGYTLDFIHLDIPFSYPRNGVNGLSWSELVVVEDYVRNAVGVEVGMVCTDNVGGMNSSNLWRQYVLEGVTNYLDAGGQPEALMLFSWFLYPTETVPDTLTEIPPGTATQLRVLRELANTVISVSAAPLPQPAVQLYPPIPNPFNPRTTIVYELPEQETVRLHVYDVSGRLVRTLLNGEMARRGRNEVIWNGRDDAGRHVASGVYFFRIEACGYRATQRMMLVR